MYNTPIQRILLRSVVMGGLENGSTTSKSSNRKKSPESDKIMIRVMTNVYVKRHLKAPSTAKFPTWSDEYKIETIGNKKYKVSACVDAQNSFGAMIRNYFTVLLEHKGGDKWKLIDIKMSE